MENKRNSRCEERERDSLKTRGAPYGLVNLTLLTRKPRRAREERKSEDRVRGKCRGAKGPGHLPPAAALQRERERGGGGGLIVRTIVKNVRAPIYERIDVRPKDAVHWRVVLFHLVACYNVIYIIHFMDYINHIITRYFENLRYNFIIKSYNEYPSLLHVTSSFLYFSRHLSNINKLSISLYYDNEMLISRIFCRSIRFLLIIYILLFAFKFRRL